MSAPVASFSVGVAAKIIARLKQTQFCLAAQRMRGTKAGNAGADDGDLHGTDPIRVELKAQQMGNTEHITLTIQNLNFTVIL